MARLTKEEKMLKNRALMAEHRIAFKGAWEANQCSSAHKDDFEAIKQLGESNYASYNATSSSDRPWRADIKARAKSLAEKAFAQFSRSLDEAEWRYALESHVFMRFETEVSWSVNSIPSAACFSLMVPSRRCSSRLWRSEIEAKIQESDDSADLLRERRRQRTPCRCPPEFGSEGR